MLPNRNYKISISKLKNNLHLLMFNPKIGTWFFIFLKIPESPLLQESSGWSELAPPLKSFSLPRSFISSLCIISMRCSSEDDTELFRGSRSSSATSSTSNIPCSYSQTQLVLCSRHTHFFKRRLKISVNVLLLGRLVTRNTERSETQLEFLQTLSLKTTKQAKWDLISY